MTLRENLTVIPRIYGQKSSLSQSVSTFIQESGLEAFIDVRVGELSGGFRQLAAFSCAIASAPDVLLLDEPLSELDSLHAQQICDTVDRLCSTLMFLVISSHDAPDLSFLNRRVIVKNGTVE
jgi:ABC-type multidrug transport system ATPase subunit